MHPLHNLQGLVVESGSPHGEHRFCSESFMMKVRAGDENAARELVRHYEGVISPRVRLRSRIGGCSAPVRLDGYLAIRADQLRRERAQGSSRWRLQSSSSGF